MMTCICNKCGAVLKGQNTSHQASVMLPTEPWHGHLCVSCAAALKRWLTEPYPQDEAEQEAARLRQAIVEAMASLATGPAKHGYAYTVLGRALSEVLR